MQSGVVALLLAPLSEDHRIIPKGRSNQAALTLRLRNVEAESFDKGQAKLRLVRSLGQRQVYCRRYIRSVGMSFGKKVSHGMTLFILSPRRKKVSRARWQPIFELTGNYMPLWYVGVGQINELVVFVLTMLWLCYLC